MRLRHLLLIFLLFAFPILLPAQTDTTWFNDKWKKTTRDSAAFFRPALTKQDKLFLVRDYYKNGALQMQGYSLSPTEVLLTGEANWYEKDGKLKQKSFYSSGKLHGTTTGYADGKIYATVEYYFGNRQGSMIRYYPSGKIASKYTYINDQLSGLCEDYHENGQVSERIVYENGKRNGETTEYYPSGKLKSKIIWKDGKRNGADEEFYENGNLKSRSVYAEGKNTEQSTLYYSNGAVNSIAETADDQLHGKFEIYDSLGTIIARAKFSKGWITDSFYHAGDAFTIRGLIQNKKPAYWEYNSAAGERRIMTIEANQVEHWKVFTKGDISIDAYYQNGFPVNHWTFYENKKIRSEIDFREAREIKAEEEKEEKEEESSESKRKDFFTDYTDLDEKELTALFPGYYYKGIQMNDNPDDISSSSFYNTITRHYFNGQLKLIRKHEWDGDSVFVKYAFPAAASISGLKFTMHENADALKLIPMKENYRLAANECAVFAEPRSDWIEKRVLEVALGSKLKKEILSQPSKIEWLVDHIEKNQTTEQDKAIIAKAVLTELYAQ